MVPEENVQMHPVMKQLMLFTDGQEEKQQQEEQVMLEREKKVQKTLLGIKKKYGKNAILKGIDLQEGATMRERNTQIGGHRA